MSIKSVPPARNKSQNEYKKQCHLQEIKIKMSIKTLPTGRQKNNKNENSNMSSEINSPDEVN